MKVALDRDRMLELQSGLLDNMQILVRAEDNKVKRMRLGDIK